MFVELLKDFLGQKAGARIDVADADAQALVSAGTARAVHGDPLAESVGKAVGDALGKIIGGLQTAVDAALKDFAAAQSHSRKNAVPRIFGENGGDTRKSFGAFLLAVRHGDTKPLDEMGSRYVEWDADTKKTAMSTQTGTTGGYLVPTEFHAKLMALVDERSVVRPRATVIPMSARSVQVPALDVTTAPAAGDTAFLGGVVARWTEEAATLNETEPALKQVELVNYELSGYSKVSNTLLADNAVGLDAFLMSIFARAIAWYEDHAFLRPPGAGQAADEHLRPAGGCRRSCQP